MSAPDLNRLRKELVDCGKDFEGSGVHAEPAGAGSDLTKLMGKIKGPKDSPYEGGIFFVDINIPAGYPFVAPKMKFVTQIWHPNVSSQTGAICLDILKDAWSPALTIKTALLSLQALLSAPEPKDPQDAEVASQYLKERKKWELTAKFWTESYAAPRAAGASGATASLSEEQSKVKQLVDMGFDSGSALRALRQKGGNLEQAVEMLFASA